MSEHTHLCSAQSAAPRCHISSSHQEGGRSKAAAGHLLWGTISERGQRRVECSILFFPPIKIFLIGRHLNTQSNKLVEAEKTDSTYR